MIHHPFLRTALAAAAALTLTGLVGCGGNGDIELNDVSHFHLNNSTL